MAEDAIARAKAIAARLAAGGAGVGVSVSASSDSELGKRKNRWEDDYGNNGGPRTGLGLMKKQKVYVPVRKYPDTNFIGLLIGPRGRTQKDLEHRTGTKIIFRGRGSQKDGVGSGHPDDDDELHISVEGPADCVAKAVVEIEEILFNPQKAEQLKQQQLKNLADMNNQLTVYGPGGGGTIASDLIVENGEGVIELKVPNNMVGYVIGKGGENIQKMQAQTGAHIQIAKESEMKPGETMRRVTLRGPTAGVKDLQRRIEDLINEKMNFGKPTGPKQPKDLDSSYILKVAIPNDKVGLIIGKNGLTVKGIQERTFTTVLIPPGADEDNPAIRTLSIGGETQDAVEACQMEIFLTLQQQQQMVAPSMTYIIVPDNKVGIIIGRGGCTIKEIQMRTGCKILIPPMADVGSDPPVRTLSISGPTELQQVVKQEIESILGIQSEDPSLYDPTFGTGQIMADQYAAMYSAAAAAIAATQSAAQQDPSTIDPTSYYPDFWNYASVYGEEAARVYYTTWSPPIGTLPPPGIVLPGSTYSDPNSSAYNAAAYGAQGDPYATSAQYQSTSADTQYGSSSDSYSAGYGIPAGTTYANQEQVQGSAGTAEAAQDPEAVAAAWELYNKQYAEWMQYQQQTGGEVPPAEGQGP